MSDVSVSAIRLPGLRGRWRSESLSRRALLAVFRRIRVGSLTIHEGDTTLHFGDETAPGEPHAVINVHDPAVYHRVLTGGSVGSGEAYMLGHWSSPELIEVIRLFCANMAVLQSMDEGQALLRRLGLRVAHFLNSNTLRGSKRNISAHYDLGNDFFRLFLDPTMMYSSAVFPRPSASLEEASVYKLDLICRQLELKPTDHLVEIGTGWGGFALHAAQHYGCRVTTTTISAEQHARARARIDAAGLGDRITLLQDDFRDLEGRYDKLVSIEMIEAIDHGLFETYFRQCSALLKPEGAMLIQAITIADQRYEQYRKEVDFIRRYIFPGSGLPSSAVITETVARHTDLRLLDLEDIGLHYATTLAHWRRNFEARLDEVRAQGYPESFVRMWTFYLCYCEGAFLERAISDLQLVFSKPDCRLQPSGAGA